MILKDRFSLESMSISFIKYPFSKVKQELKSIVFETLNKKWEVKQYSLINSSELSSFVLRSDFDEVKVLIWQPGSISFELVVFLTNMPDGWQTLLNYYFDKCNREIIRVKLSEETRMYPIYLFEYMKTSNRRIIQLMKDSDKWKFFESGSIMPFENSLNYRKRKISDRLDNSIIEDYLKKNGIDITKDNFWVSKGDAIEFSTKLNGK